MGVSQDVLRPLASCKGSLPNAVPAACLRCGQCLMGSHTENTLKGPMTATGDVRRVLYWELEGWSLQTKARVPT